MATILITGGTGMIGKALTAALVKKGYDIIILTRNPKQPADPSGNIRFAQWDLEKGEIDNSAFSAADMIVHLAGANVGEKRWSGQRKKEILESRTKSGDLLVKHLTGNSHKIRAVISASAIGWYGPDQPVTGDRHGFTENDPHYEDFLGQTCKRWEQSIEPVTGLGIRLVIFRTGIVLANEGGAFPEFKKPLNFGLATILGSGKQIISWIHLDDLVRMYMMAIEKETMSGVYNGVAPAPVSNKEMILKIAALKRNKFFIPVHVPAFALKIAIGEMSVEVLKSATVSSRKIQDQGFKFLYPVVDGALEQLLKEEH